MASPGLRPVRELQCVQFPGGGFIPIPKNGSTTILRPLWAKYPGTREDSRTANTLTGHVVAMLREPTERMWSVYLHERRPSRGALAPRTDESNWFPDPNLPWEAWLQALAEEGLHCGEMWEGYILPQTWFLKDADVDVVRWDFPAIEEKLQIRLGHENKRQTDRSMPDITPRMQYHLEAIYGADYELWAKIGRA